VTTTVTTKWRIAQVEHFGRPAARIVARPILFASIVHSRREAGVDEVLDRCQLDSGRAHVMAIAVWTITGDGRAPAFEGWALAGLYVILATVVGFE
jgi:hypothetical protein